MLKRRMIKPPYTPHFKESGQNLRKRIIDSNSTFQCTYDRLNLCNHTGLHRVTFVHSERGERGPTAAPLAQRNTTDMSWGELVLQSPPATPQKSPHRLVPLLGTLLIMLVLEVNAPRE